jgi:hypothetical protein
MTSCTEFCKNDVITVWRHIISENGCIFGKCFSEFQTMVFRKCFSEFQTMLLGVIC